jgi:rhomboid protease GluP
VLIVALLVVGAVIVRLMTSDERKRALQTGLDVLKQLRAARANIRPCEPLRTNLHQRTPRILVTPALAAAMVLTLLVGSVDALGNLGPQTTAGEWWRLITATFVHAGAGALIVSLVAFVQPALLLERLVGPIAFAAVYLASAATAGVMQLSANPVGVNAGATPALMGVYGLLLVVIAGGYLRRSPVTVPFLAIKRMAPSALLFVLHTLATNRLTDAAIAGLVTGLGSGVVLAFGLGERKPPIRRTAAALSASAIITIAVAISIGDIIDARPEIANVVALERRTADAYNAAVDRFRQGRIKSDALVKLIEQTIVPELKAAEKRVTALESVPKEQQPLVTHAGEYLRLRSESWRLRSEGLRTTNLQRLRQAERTERASLGALEQIKPKTDPPPAH